MKVEILHPTFPEATTLTKDDVWGKWTEDHVKVHGGMVVADSTHGGFDEKNLQSKGVCPIFGDHIPWKSATIVGPKALAEQIAYWLEYVQGADCISKVKDLDGDRIAYRADYQAW